LFVAALMGFAVLFINPSPASAKTRKAVKVCKGATVIPYLSDTGDNAMYGFTSLARDYSGFPGSLKGAIAKWNKACDPARKRFRKYHKAEVIYAIASHDDYDGYFIRKRELWERSIKMNGSVAVKDSDGNFVWEKKKLSEADVGEIMRKGLDEYTYGDMLAGDRDGLPHGRKSTLSRFARAARKASGYKVKRRKPKTDAKAKTRTRKPRATAKAEPAPPKPTVVADAKPIGCTVPTCPDPRTGGGIGGGGGPIHRVPANPESGELP